MRSPTDTGLREALWDLRTQRRRNRLSEWNFIDALYKAYVGALVLGVVVTALSGMTGDQRILDSEIDDVLRRGPGLVGMFVAFGLAVALRSGARGGPLALEAADVRHVLMAPVDRAFALRGPAVKQLRFLSFTGAVAGAVAGLLAYRRLPGSPVAWVAAGAAVGGLAAAGGVGAAMLAAGRRLGRGAASALGVVLLAWAGADVALGWTTSPMALLGGLALWPLEVEPLDLVGALSFAALAVAGLVGVRGLSLEAAERRGRLVGHLRFAATLQDIRTVMLLRRQLAFEQPRATPWVRMGRRHGRFPIWRRDWQGIARWPITRALRMVGLGLAAVAACAGAWQGTTPLVFLAGAVVHLAALDATEGLSQEVDHPDRRDAVPMARGALHLRHLAAPVVLLATVGMVGVAAVALFSAETALRVGLPLVVPVALAAVASAAITTVRQPPNPERLIMDQTGLMMFQHQALPPLVATAGPALLLLARPGSDGSAGEPLAMAFPGVGLLLLVALVLGWVRHREGIAEAKAGAGLSAVGR